MTLADALRLTRAEIATANVDCDAIEAVFLLCHALKISRLQTYTELERPVSSREIAYLKHLARRRVLDEPLPYILHHCEFCGIEFYVDRRVLIPRPETEFLVEKAAEYVRHYSSGSKQVTIADIGTGCGAIAINLALAFPHARVYATDVSASALQVARLNCHRHRVEGRVKLLQGNLLAPLIGRVDVILANLPYVRNGELQALTSGVLGYEPTLALSGGDDGMEALRPLLAQVPEKLSPGGCVVLEIGQGQDQALIGAIAAHTPGAGVELISDLAGINRVICVHTCDSGGQPTIAA